MKRSLTVLLLAGMAAQIASAAQSASGGSASDNARESRLQWWRQARFGLFMHWGVYAVPAGEWKGLEKQKDLWGEWIMQRARIPVAEYEPLAKQFNPVRFDALEWVRMAKRSGMRYIVITAKHCDGFAMFRSQASKYNIVDATPFARDPMLELADACRREGLKLGFYYSHSWDWHEPDALGLANDWDFPDRSKKDINKYLQSKSLPQVRELVTQYRPAIMWFDVPSDLTKEHSQAFVDIIRKTAPDCIVNDRVGNGLGDYSTPEQFIPRRKPQADFEVCMTLNEHWGYDKNDHNWKQAPAVVRHLVETASKGGNYLLNVGPTAEGVFPPDALRVLSDVGRWMDVNGESVYGTAAGPLPTVPWGYTTSKGSRVYLHVFDWPADRRLRVPGVRSRIRQASLLAGSQHERLRTTRAGDWDYRLQLPQQAPDAIDSVVVLEFDGKPDFDPTPVLFNQRDYPLTLDAGSATIHGAGAKYQGLSLQRREFDRIGDWTDPATWSSWNLRASEGGTFEVRVSYNAAAVSAGNQFVVTAGGNTLSATVQATGGREDFKTFTLGVLTMRPGSHDLAIKPKEIAPGSVLMSLHSVALVSKHR